MITLNYENSIWGKKTGQCLHTAHPVSFESLKSLTSLSDSKRNYFNVFDAEVFFNQFGISVYAKYLVFSTRLS